MKLLSRLVYFALFAHSSFAPAGGPGEYMVIEEGDKYEYAYRRGGFLIEVLDERGVPLRLTDVTLTEVALELHQRDIKRGSSGFTSSIDYRFLEQSISLAGLSKDDPVRALLLPPPITERGPWFYTGVHRVEPRPDVQYLRTDENGMLAVPVAFYGRYRIRYGATDDLVSLSIDNLFPARSIQFLAKIVDEQDGRPLSGITTAFYINGKKEGSVESDTNGMAKFEWPVDTVRWGISTDATQDYESGAAVGVVERRSELIVKETIPLSRVVYWYRILPDNKMGAAAPGR